MDYNINRLLPMSQGKKKKNSWEDLEIVVYESRYAGNISYRMGMEEFLCKLLKKEIECPIFPDDFILESNYYLKYTYQAPN